MTSFTGADVFFRQQITWRRGDSQTVVWMGLAGVCL